MFIVHQLEEIQGLIEAHNQFKNTLGAADAEFVAVEGLVQQVQTIATKYGLGRDAIENPYTNLTITVSGSVKKCEQAIVTRFACFIYLIIDTQPVAYDLILNIQNSIHVMTTYCVNAM